VEECVVREKSKQNWLIAIASAAVFMFSVDYSMVNISLPSIAVYFKASIGHVSRIPLAYLLVVTSTVLLFGKLGDVIGLKKIFITGLIIFVTGTFLCGMAPTLNALLGLRIYQCVGEAMFSPIAIALVTVFLPPGIKGKALGFMATAQGLGFCLGPILGGFLNYHMGWHSIFFVNIPLGLAVIITALKTLPSKQSLPVERRIDITGSVLIFISLTIFVFAVNSISEMGLRHPVIISCLAAALAAFVLFLIQERRAKNPILHLSLFKNMDFTFATASAFCVIFVYIGLMFLFPFYLNVVIGISMMHAGFFLMLPAFMVIISSPVAGLISDKFGSRLICVFGISLTTLAFFLFSLLKPDMPLFHIVPPLIIAGIAVGCFLPANNKLVMAHAPSDKQGMTAAIYKILNSTGGVFGIAILPMVLMRKAFARAAIAHIDKSMIRHYPDILTAGFDAAFKFGMLVCLVGLVFTVLAKDKKD
jgi:DHA2 family metal-tetracycline-proton antiporter-like MFS transporter